MRRPLGIGEVFAMFSPDFMAAGREFHAEQERDWSAPGKQANAENRG